MEIINIYIFSVLLFYQVGIFFASLRKFKKKFCKLKERKIKYYAYTKNYYLMKIIVNIVPLNSN